MTITEQGYFVCDYCGDDTGRFNSETGNHDACEKLHAAKAVIDAARELQQQLAVVHTDEKYKSVWVSYYIHHGQYDGPQYTNQLIKLAAKLAEYDKEAE